MGQEIIYNSNRKYKKYELKSLSIEYFIQLSQKNANDSFKNLEYIEELLGEQNIQVKGIKLLEIFKNYLFYGKNLTINDYDLLENLSNLEVKKNWSFYTKIFAFQAKSIKAFFSGDSLSASRHQTKILQLWAQNPIINELHIDFFLDFAEISFYITFVNSTHVKSDSYSLLLELLSVQKYLGELPINVVTRIEKIINIVELSNVFFSLIGTNIKNLKEYNQSILCPINYNFDRNEFFACYIKSCIALKLKDVDEAIIYTRYIFEQTFLGCSPKHIYAPSVLMMHICLIYQTCGREEAMEIIRLTKRLLNNRLENPFIQLFFDFITNFIKDTNAVNKVQLIKDYQEKCKAFKQLGGEIFLHNSFNYLLITSILTPIRE